MFYQEYVKRHKRNTKKILENYKLEFHKVQPSLDQYKSKEKESLSYEEEILKRANKKLNELKYKLEIIKANDVVEDTKQREKTIKELELTIQEAKKECTQDIVHKLNEFLIIDL